MKRSNALYHAVCAALETDKASSAPSPETIEHMPADARNPSGPVELAKRNYMDAGKHRAELLLGAEEAEIKALQGIAQTRLDGQIELCAIVDTKERHSYIAGVQAKFSESDPEAKPNKTHSNYLTELRRVSKHLEVNANSPDVIGWAIKLLEGPGLYRDKIAKFDTSKPAANKGKGTGVNALGEALKTAALTELKAEGIENPSEDQVIARVREKTVTTPPSAGETEKPAGEPPMSVGELDETLKAEKAKGDLEASGEVNQKPSESPAIWRQTAQQIEFLHDDGIETCAIAMGHRMMQSETYREVGRMLIAALDDLRQGSTGETEPETETAPVQQPETKEQAHTAQH